MLEEEKLRVQLVYLPKLYEEALKELGRPLDERVVELARVEHGGRSGISPKLLRPWSEEELEELKRAKEAILKLSPGRLGLKDYLWDAGVKALAGLGVAASGVPVALALERVLKPIAQLKLKEAASALLERVRKIPSGLVEELVSRVLVSLAKPEARDKVAEGLARVIASARGAARYLDGGWLEDALETVWDQVALEWGMDVSTFKTIVRNFAKLAEGELVTREELRVELGKLLGEEAEKILKPLIEKQLEKAWEEERKELEVLRQELRQVLEDLSRQRKLHVVLYYTEDAEKGLLYKHFKVEDGKPKIKSEGGGGQPLYVDLVTAGGFEKLAREVLERLGRDGIVILEGPKGIGKSALAAYVVWKALRNGFVDSVALPEESPGFEDLLDIVEKGRFLALYDPSPLKAYYKPEYAGKEVSGTVEEVEEVLGQLFELAESGNRVSVLVVLPRDIYQCLIKRNPKLRSKIRRFILRVNLRNPWFLERIIRAYSGCTGSFEELAETIARFEGGYTLIAKYAGLALREKCCGFEDVEEMLEEAKGKPKLFLAYYLWSVLLRGNEDLAKRIAVPLLLHAEFGPIPEGITYLMAARGPPWRFLEPWEVEEKRYTLQDLKDEELEPVARWLSVRHEDLVEEMLRELCSLGGEARKQYAQHLPKLAGYQRGAGDEQGVLEWALNKIKEETNGVGIEATIGEFEEFVGERLAAALTAYAPKCWRRLALIAGSILAELTFRPVPAAEACRLPNEALKPCEADSYLLADDRLLGGISSTLVDMVALSKPSVFLRPLACRHREAAEEIKKLEKTWRERGVSPAEARYALGLALTVAEAVVLGEKVDVWEVEAALFAATVAVQEVCVLESIAAVLEIFKPLGELVPHCHVMLASVASKSPEQFEETTREIADAVDEALRTHREELERRGWPLVSAINAYSNLIANYREHFLRTELKRMSENICELLGKLDGQLRVIAEAYALRAALEGGLEPCSGGEAVSKAIELLRELERIEKEEPSGQAIEWAREWTFKPEGFKLAVKDAKGSLVYALAKYMLVNDDLEAAGEYFKNAALIFEELKDWENFLTARWLAARCYVLKAGSLDEMIEHAKIFTNIWSETREKERSTGIYFEDKVFISAEYLISQAFEGRMNEVYKELLKDEWFVDEDVAVKLLLKQLGIKVEKPKAQDIALALREHTVRVFQPALNFLIGLPENVSDEYNECACLLAINAVRGDGKAARILKSAFLRWLSNMVKERLEEFAQGAEGRETMKRFYRELRALVKKRDAGTVVQLWAPKDLFARIILRLWALSNGDEELARAHAKLMAVLSEGKLSRRLFREAAEARSEEEHKLALLKLFYYSI